MRKRAICWGVLLACACLWSVGDTQAQPARHGLTAAEFELQTLFWLDDRLRPKTLDATTIGETPIFSGIWESYDPRDPAQDWTFDLEMTGAELQKLADELGPQGFRPVSLAAYEKKDGPRFAVIWHRDPNATYFWRAGLSGEEYQELFDQLSEDLCGGRSADDGETNADGEREPVAGVVVRGRIARGLIREIPGRLNVQPIGPKKSCRFRLVDVDGYREAKEQRFFALWVLEPGGYTAQHGMTRHRFDFEHPVTGYQAVKVAPYPIDESADHHAYAKLWYWMPDRLHFMYSHLSGSDYQDVYELKTSQGYTLLDIAATDDDSKALYTTLWLAPRGPDDMLQLGMPIGGVPYSEWVLVNYQDHIVDTGMMDHMGGTWLYDGHNGTDLTIRNFEQMDRGVDVLAAADGTVVDVVDGNFDRNVCGSTCGPCVSGGNFIDIEHRNGQRTWYMHLRENSTIVSIGDTVVRGQKIAEIGSSGNSSDAHLHFAVLDGPIYSKGLSGGDLVDPFEGPFGNSENLWITAIPYGPTLLNFMDAGVTNFIPDRCEWTERPPQIYFFDPGDTVVLWMQMNGTVDASNTLVQRVFDPDGDLLDEFPLASGSYQYSWPRIVYDATSLANYKEGIYTYTVERNGVEVFRRQFEVD